jgi:DNA polymerase bacteriophage-type
MIVSIDFETRSRVDLPTYGLDKYSRDKSTEVLCMAYSIDGAPVELWNPFESPAPSWLVDESTSFTAWNAAFEVNILRNVLKIPVRWEQFTDTMAWAAANNIPQSLEEAALFLGVTEQKDPVGKRLIQKLSKPNIKGVFNEDPELLSELYNYCKQDVRTEMAVAAQLRPLDPSEQSVWVLTNIINDNGVPVDPAEIERAINASVLNKDTIVTEMSTLTGGISPSQPAKIVEWLRSHKIVVEDLTAETVHKLLQTVKDPTVKRVLELRRQGSLTSVAKYEKMLEVQVGGRIRNTLVYHGASTGRFASRGGLNLQNIARPHLDGEALEEAVERVLVRGEGGTMDELSSLVRSAIKAPDGQTFVDADFSSIENRVASWIAGQNDKVELFRKGLDEYKTFASNSLYRVPYEEVTKEMRQVSKSAVLGCMFGQGAKGLVQYAEGMGVNLSMVESERAVNAYRSEYARVKSAWHEFEAAAIQAVQVPGTAARSGKVTFKSTKGALWMRLPSGRLICWRDPMVEPQLTPWGAMRDGVTVRNQNTFTRKWGRNKLIGSSIFQSAVQATARDMLTEAMLRLNDVGYSMVNSVHDEILLLVSEADGETALGRVIEVMTTPPKWAPDFPLAAEGWFGKRYRK